MAQTTTDHDRLRKWAEARDGRPARVKGTGDAKGTRACRLDFGKPEESLEEITWEYLFEKFDESEPLLSTKTSPIKPRNSSSKLVRR